MALKAVLTPDEYEALDDGFRAQYKQTQSGDHWVLDLEGVDDHPVVKGMATTLRKFKEVAPDANVLKTRFTEHDTLKADLEALQETWKELEAEEVREQLKRLEELEKGDGKVDVAAQIDSAKAVLERKHARALQDVETKRATLEKQLTDREQYISDLILEQELEAGLAHIKAIEELRPGAKALIRARYKLSAEREEDEVTGKPRYKGVVKTDLGENSVADFFERWQTEPEAEPYLPASGNAGTGSKSGDGGGGGRKTNPWAKDTFNLTEQGKLVRDNPALAKQMAAAAGKSVG